MDYVEEQTEGQIATIIAPHQFIFIWNKGGDYSEVNNNALLYSAPNYYIFGDKFFNKIELTKNNTYLIIYEHDIYRTSGVKEHLENNFDFLKQIGYYRIYKYKG